MSQHQEHGTTRSYIIGFALSLLFTMIPYEMVVRQTVRGNALLYTILGFAVLQLLVQLLFFLHLGRGPQARWNVYFLVGTLSLVLVTVAGSIVIIKNLHYNMSVTDQIKKIANDEGIYEVNGERTGACKGDHKNYIVTISSGVVTPAVTNALLCDTITFVNKDSGTREMSFGEPSSPERYAGEDTMALPKNYNKTLTLSDPGTLQFFDSKNPDTIGTFIVTRK